MVLFLVNNNNNNTLFYRKEHILFGYTARILVLKIFNVYLSYRDAFYFHFVDLEKGRIFTSVNIGLECFNLKTEGPPLQYTSCAKVCSLHNRTTKRKQNKL